MFWGLFFKDKHIVALDIGSHSIKMGEFTIQKKKPYLENFDFLPMPKNSMTHGDIVNPTEISEILPSFIEQNMGTKTKKLHVSLSGKSIIVKKIEVPKADKNTLDAMMSMEVTQHFPFSLSDINYDYEILNVNGVESDKLCVLVVVAKKSPIDACNDLISKAGFQCECIESGSNALANCFKVVYPELTKKKEPVVMLDIGKSGTSYNVFFEGQLIFARYLQIGSDFFNSNLMSQMEVSEEEAESLKIGSSIGEETPQEVDTIFRRSYEDFISGLQQAQENYQSQFPSYKNLKSCYITGGGSKQEGMVEYLADQLELSIQHVDPFNGSVGAKDFLLDSLDNIKLFSSTIVGLSARHIVN